MIKTKRNNIHEVMRNRMYWQPKGKKPVQLKSMSRDHLLNVYRIIKKEYKPQVMWCGFPADTWLKFIKGELNYRDRLANAAFEPFPYKIKKYLCVPTVHY